MDDNDNTPSIYDLDDRLDEVVLYFNEIEEKLTEQTGFPVRLQQARTAYEASVMLTVIIEAERERNRYWKHRDPDETVIAFATTVEALLDEHELTWETLAERLGLAADTFRHVRWFAKDPLTPEEIEELQRLAEETDDE